VIFGRVTDQHDQNRRVWNRLAHSEPRFAAAASDAELANPLASLDSYGWLGPSVAGRSVLCLASGGGRQGVLFAAAGATVTVLDLSPEMLALDRQVAAQRGFDLETIEGSMDNLAMLAPAKFDIVWQAVSTCYVPDVGSVYRQVARVIRPGGVYLSQHKQPVSLQAVVKPTADGYQIVEPYYRTDPLQPTQACAHRERGAVEYLHRWEQLVGELCRAGFVIEDLVEPCHAKSDASRDSFARRSRYLPPYVRIKARRVGPPDERAETNRIVTP